MFIEREIKFSKFNIINSTRTKSAVVAFSISLLTFDRTIVLLILSYLRLFYGVVLTLAEKAFIVENYFS